MASFTELVGGSPVNPSTGTHLAQVTVEQGRIGDLGTYLNIVDVNHTTENTSSPDYDPNFANTLYYIRA